MPSNRWDPTSALSRIEQDMNAAAHQAHPASVRTATDGDDLVITVEGVDPSDIDVQVSGGRVTIRGGSGSSTSQSHDEGGAHFSSSSSSSSSFSRSFSLPDGVERSDITTQPSGNGVTVRIRNAA